MWNTVKIYWRSTNNTNTLQQIGEMIFNGLKTYNVNDHALSKARRKRIEKAQKEKHYEDALYILIKSGGISKTTFKRFLTEVYDKNSNMYEYYINYKYYDTIIERLLDYVQIIDRNILNSPSTVTKNFIPKQKNALDDIHTSKYKYQFYYKYYTNKLCILNESLNELDVRRPI